MKKITLTKLFSTTLSLALVATSAPIPAGAVGPVGSAAPAFVAGLTPPEKFGYVASSFSPNKEAKVPRLILISDLHAHVEVQHNIMGILNDIIGKLNPTPSKRLPIFVEGGWDAHLEEPLRNVANPKTREFLSEYLMQKAQLGSAQAFSEQIAGSNKVNLIGVEDKTIYEGNRKQYVRTYPARKMLMMALAREEKAMRKLSKYVANGSFQKLQTMRDDYNAGRIGMDRYAKMLLRHAGHYHIAGHATSVLENMAQANPEDLEVSLNEVYRLVVLKMSVNAPWTSFLRQSLGNEEMMRLNIARFDADFDLLKRLLANQLTPGEVPLAAIRMPYLKKMSETLVGNSAKEDASKVIEQSIGFYPYAYLRDEILVKNSLKALDQTNDKDAMGVLVVGGFHVDAIMQYLQNKGISYLHINPTVSRDMTTEEQLNYVKRMGNEPVTANELKNDLDRLSGGPAALRGSAIGAVSDASPTQNPAGKIPGVDNPGNDPTSRAAGVVVAALEAQKGQKVENSLKALKAYGFSRVFDRGEDGMEGVEFGNLDALRVGAREARTVDAAAADRLDNLANKIDAAIGANSANAGLADVALLPNSFTLVLNPMSMTYSVEGDQKLSKLSPAQRAFVGRLNNTPMNRDVAPQRIDVHTATDASAYALGGEAITLHSDAAKDERVAMIFTESRMEDGVVKNDVISRILRRISALTYRLVGRWMPGYVSKSDAALIQAVNIQKHEGSHGVKVGHLEAGATADGLFNAIWFGMGHFTGMDGKSAALAVMDILAPFILSHGNAAGNERFQRFAELFAQRRFRVALAEEISAVMQGPNITDEQLMTIAENLQARGFENVPIYVIANDLKTLTNGIVSRASGNIFGDITDPAEQKRLMDMAIAKFGPEKWAQMSAAQQAEAIAA